MKIELHPHFVRFMHQDRLVAEYVLDDTYKPYFRSLSTPAGHETVVVSPGDHRHHKGLMYALRCEDLNFWEETPGWHCGVQRSITTELTPERDGIVQQLIWEGEAGDLQTYKETRTIRVHYNEVGRAFQYTWSTQRTALRDHTLIKSPHSLEVPDGRKINYHGLGIRLPWMWRFPVESMGGVESEGKAVDPMEACGSTTEQVGFWGLIGGEWNRTVASVTFRQPAEQAFSWFVLKGDFPYLAVGPSNEQELHIKTGEQVEETYVVEVADRDPTFGKS